MVFFYFHPLGNFFPSIGHVCAGLLKFVFKIVEYTCREFADIIQFSLALRITGYRDNQSGGFSNSISARYRMQIRKGGGLPKKKPPSWGKCKKGAFTPVKIGGGMGDCYYDAKTPAWISKDSEKKWRIFCGSRVQLPVNPQRPFLFSLLPVMTIRVKRPADAAAVVKMRALCRRIQDRITTGVSVRRTTPLAIGCFASHFAAVGE